MPQFPAHNLQPIRHNLMGAYISGRAQKMAYEQDKVRNSMMQEQAKELAWGNSPEGMKRKAEEHEMKRRTSIINQQSALRDAEAFKRELIDIDASGGITRTSYDKSGKAKVTQTGNFESPTAGVARRYPSERKFQNESGTYMVQDVDPQTGEDIGMAVPLWKPTTETEKGFSADQAKAAGWLESFLVGEKQLEEMIETGYRPSAKELIAYKTMIDDQAGAAKKVLARSFISEEAEVFFNSIYAMVNPKVRNDSGAAIRPGEFELEFEAMVPYKDQPKTVSFKKLYRDSTRRALEIRKWGAEKAPDTGATVGRFKVKVKK